MLKTIKPTSWSFAIEFDEEKTKHNGYDIETLYDYVGKNIEHLGIERIARDTWKVKDIRDKVTAQCTALCGLARKGWVMENIKSWTVYEGDPNDGHDYLQVIREVSPELMCV